MESWNNVINAALLGTEKRGLKESEMDATLAESFALITEQTTDREEAFLQTAALVYNMRQCGFLPLQKEIISIAAAGAEENAYASSLAHSVLADVLETGSISLLRFWLAQCSGANKIVEPEMIPTLLNVGMKTKSLQSLVALCCGKRGEWLQQFNEEWRWYKTDSGEDVWQTGTLSQRKEYLAQLRQNDPTKGRELLQQTWAQESAATKTELLEQIRVNASDDDVQWLEELLNEKSVKVKDAALQLLKTLPTSAIVQQYWNILKQSVKVVTSKGLLGIGAKTSLEIKLTGLDDSIFKTGVQPVSDQKGVSDEDFVLWQLIAQIPPLFWEEHLKLTKDEIIKLFFKQHTAKEFIGAVKRAALQFNDVMWMKALIRIDKTELHASAFQLLAQKDAEQYALEFLNKNSEGETIIQYLSFFPAEWSHDFALGILQHLARFPYRFHRNFYYENAQQFPVSIIPFLDTIKVPSDQYAQQMWDNTNEHLKRLLFLKEQTFKAFNE